MRKLAWLAIAVFTILIIVATLGAVNYANIGDTLGGFMQNTMVLPIRNFFVNLWNTIGTSGWYIVVATLVISLVGAAFWVPIAYNLFWKKAVMQKLLHRTPQTAPAYQSSPTTTIPVTQLQSAPTPQTPAPKEPEKEEK